MSAIPQSEIENVSQGPDPIPFDVDQYFYGWNATQPQDKMADNHDSFGKILHSFTRPFLVQGYNTMAALNRATASLFGHLDLVSDYIEASGMGQKGGLFEKLSQEYSNNANYWRQRADAAGINFLDEIVSEAIGGAVPGITQFALDIGSGLTLPYMAGAAEAYKKEQSPFAAGMVEAAKTGLLGAVFQMMTPLKTYLKLPATGTIFGFQEMEGAPEGEKAKAFAKGAAIGAGYSLSSPGGRLGLNEIYEKMRPRIEEARSMGIEEQIPFISEELPPNVIDFTERLDRKILKQRLELLKSQKGAINLPTAIERESVYQNVVNRFAAIENLDERAKALGATIEPGESPRMRAREYLGLSGKVQSILRDKTYRINQAGKVEITGEGLKPILDDYQRLSPEKNLDVKTKEFNDYFIALRTIEDLQRPKGEWTTEEIVTPQQVQDAQNTLYNLQQKYGNLDQFTAVADRIFDYQKRVLHTLVDSGNLSEERYQNIINLNPHYVPFDRVMDEVEPSFFGGGPKASKPFTEARSPVKRIKGSEREIEDIVGSIVRNTYRIVDVAERNTVANTVAKLMDIPELGIEKVPIPTRPIHITSPEVERILEQTGQVIQPPVEEEVFRPSPYTPKGQIIEYYKNGKKQYMDVPQNLYDAMHGMNKQSSDMLTKILSAPASLLRSGVTKTPEFIARNFIRDQMDGLVQNQAGFIPGIDTIRALADIIGKSDVYYDWLRSGGAHSTFVDLGRKNLEQISRELQKDPSALRYLNIINDAAEISQAIESATRLGIYKAAIRSGKSPVEAAFMAREGTVDFGVHGQSEGLRKFSSITAFFNPAIQGTDRAIRAHIDNPVSTAMKGIASITIPSVILWYLNKDDPDYKELPQWQKDLFWLIKVGDRGSKIEWVRIPKPFILGEVYGSAPERFLTYLDTKDPKALKGFFKSLIDAATPVQGDPNGVLLPTAIKPLIENSTNWQFFKERPVVPESRKNLLPEYQYGKYTSEVAKIVGKELGWSPAKIENMVTGITGGAGQYSIDAMDQALELLGVIEKRRTRPGEAADIPLVKGFVTRPVTSDPQSLRDFYDNAKKIESNYASVRDQLKELNIKGVKELIKGEPKLFLSPSLSNAKESINHINQLIDIVSKSKMEDPKKRTINQKLETMRLTIAQISNKLVEGKLTKEQFQEQYGITVESLPK